MIYIIKYFEGDNLVEREFRKITLTTIIDNILCLYINEDNKGNRPKIWLNMKYVIFMEEV